MNSISLTALVFYFLYILIYRGLRLTDVIPYQNIFQKSFILILLIWSFYFFYTKAGLIQEIIESNFKILVFISLLAFSAIHILNYNFKEFNLAIMLASVVLVLPHFFTGYILTFVRIKNGLIWSIALHGLNNSLVLVAVLFGHTDI